MKKVKKKLDEIYNINDLDKTLINYSLLRGVIIDFYENNNKDMNRKEKDLIEIIEALSTKLFEVIVDLKKCKDK